MSYIFILQNINNDEDDPEDSNNLPPREDDPEDSNNLPPHNPDLGKKGCVTPAVAKLLEVTDILTEDVEVTEVDSEETEDADEDCKNDVGWEDVCEEHIIPEKAVTALKMKKSIILKHRGSSSEESSDLPEIDISFKGKKDEEDSNSSNKGEKRTQEQTPAQKRLRETIDVSN